MASSTVCWHNPNAGRNLRKILLVSLTDVEDDDLSTVAQEVYSNIVVDKEEHVSSDDITCCNVGDLTERDLELISNEDGSVRSMNESKQTGVIRSIEYYAIHMESAIASRDVSLVVAMMPRGHPMVSVPLGYHLGKYVTNKPLYGYDAVDEEFFGEQLNSTRHGSDVCDLGALVSSDLPYNAKPSENGSMPDIGVVVLNFGIYDDESTLLSSPIDEWPRTYIADIARLYANMDEVHDRVPVLLPIDVCIVKSHRCWNRPGGACVMPAITKAMDKIVQLRARSPKTRFRIAIHFARHCSVLNTCVGLMVGVCLSKLPETILHDRVDLISRIMDKDDKYVSMCAIPLRL